jgi:hypothetical protein
MDVLLRMTGDLYSRHLIELREIYRYQNIPDRNNSIFVYNCERLSSVNLSSLTSREIRLTLKSEQYLCNTKQLNIDEGTAGSLYKKISKIKSIQNRTKLLRLIHGDVYCRSRLMKFGITDNDRCQRCFEEETISHLLTECPFTKQVWSKLHLQPRNLAEIILDKTSAELEIITDIISELVFKKKVLQPEILLRNIYKSYAEGLCRNKQVIQLARVILTNLI